MRIETVDGVTVSDMVGGGYPFPIAVHFMAHLTEHAGLAATDHVLDIGCGCGRIAATLTQHIGAAGSYCGIDIIPGLVDFANRHIAPLAPKFRFLTLDRANQAYDGWRSKGASPVITSMEDACPAGSIDLCIATSLFTHTDAAMATETLVAMHRAMKPDGRAFITLFLIDQVTRELIRRGPAAFRFPHPHQAGTHVENPASPMSALAFSHDFFMGLLRDAGFYVEKLLYGGWPGRAHFASGQDIVILRKMG